MDGKNRDLERIAIGDAGRLNALLPSQTTLPLTAAMACGMLLAALCMSLCGGNVKLAKHRALRMLDDGFERVGENALEAMKPEGVA